MDAGSLKEVGRAARSASRKLAALSTEGKNASLLAVAEQLERKAGLVLDRNRLDLEDARAGGIDGALLDRLLLDRERIRALAASTRKVVDLPDPIGVDLERRRLPNGLQLIKRRTPLGVIGVIYEARPNVTIDIATLCLKTGNASVLRGGSETLRTNSTLVEIIQSALDDSGLPPTAVQYVGDPDRSRVVELLQMGEWIDLIIPRGGAALHALCRAKSRIPVVTGGIGICHVFVDETADLVRAVDVVENAKVQRPSVCNALDTLLVHRAVAESFIPPVVSRLRSRGVEIRATEEALRLLVSSGFELPDAAGKVSSAGPDDFDREWLSLVLGLKIVNGIDEAVAHIAAHGTGHSDAILTGDSRSAERFVNEVDSAAVYVNASTRFTDGGEFGLGAEVAVSTQKVHARGPMGLEALTSYKWIGLGDGHIRQ